MTNGGHAVVPLEPSPEEPTVRPLTQPNNTVGNDLFCIEVWQEALRPKHRNRLLHVAAKVQARGGSNVRFDVPKIVRKGELRLPW